MGQGIFMSPQNANHRQPENMLGSVSLCAEESKEKSTEHAIEIPPGR